MLLSPNERTTLMSEMIANLNNVNFGKLNELVTD